MLQTLLTSLREYADLRQADLRLKSISSLTRLFSCIVIFLIALVCVSFALMLLSLAVAFGIAKWVGGLGVSFCIIAVLYLALLALVYIKRRAWIIDPICDALARGILGDEDAEA